MLELAGTILEAGEGSGACSAIQTHQSHSWHREAGRDNRALYGTGSKKFGGGVREHQCQVPHLEKCHSTACTPMGQEIQQHHLHHVLHKVAFPWFWEQSWGRKVWAGSLLPLQTRAKQLSLCFTFLKWSTSCFILRGSQHSHALRTSVSKRQSIPQVSEGGRWAQGDHQCWLENRSSRMCWGSGVPIKAPLDGLWRKQAQSRGCSCPASVSSQQLSEQIRFPSQIHTWQWMAFSRWHV